MHLFCVRGLSCGKWMGRFCTSAGGLAPFSPPPDESSDARSMTSAAAAWVSVALFRPSLTWQRHRRNGGYGYIKSPIIAIQRAALYNKCKHVCDPVHTFHKYDCIMQVKFHLGLCVRKAPMGLPTSHQGDAEWHVVHA